MKMTKTLALIGALTSGISALAVPITGSIGFTGTYTQNGGTSGNLATATSMSIDTVGVDTADGNLTGATSPLSFATPIGVNANSTDLIGDQLWSVTVGADTFTFAVLTEAQVYGGNLPGPLGNTKQINLQGTGIMSDGAGPLDDTAGTWQLSFGVSGTSFTWQSTSAANVPDGGATAMLLGVGLVAIGALRRKS